MKTYEAVGLLRILLRSLAESSRGNKAPGIIDPKITRSRKHNFQVNQIQETQGPEENNVHKIYDSGKEDPRKHCRGKSKM